MASKSDSQPIYKNKLVIIVGVFITIVTVGTAISMSSGDKGPSSVKIASSGSAGKKISSAADTNNASEEYNKQAVEYSKKQAKKAISQDDSYVQPITNEEKAPSFAEANNKKIDDSSPISITGMLDDKKNEKEVIVQKQIIVDNTKLEQLKLELEKAKEQIKIEKENTKQMLIKNERERQSAVVAYNNEQLTKRKEAIQKVFDNYLNNYQKTAPGQPSVQVFAAYEEVKPSTKKEESAKGSPEINDKKEIKHFIKPGDMLYATNKIALNTDYSSENVVVAEVISQDSNVNKAKVFGSFKTKKDSLVLEFNKIQYEDGSLEAIKGYAVDEKNYITTVRSNYDNHYLQRYGLYLAGSFVKGLATAVTQKSSQNSTVVYDSNGNAVGQTSGDYTLTPEDSLILAGGEVATELSDTLKENLNRSPTVTLDYGKTFGIIIMSTSNSK